MATGLSTIHLYHYNNYYNRIQKRFATVAEYASYELKTNGEDVPSPIKGVSFNSGNMVNTYQVVNGISFEYSGAPDYAIVVSEDDSTKWSRWFVISCSRLRAGQYGLTLRRDLISDYYDDVVKSDCFIEKGACKIDDYAIFNKDITTPNLIKTADYPIMDFTVIPWIVGYIPRNSFKTTNDTTKLISYTETTTDSGVVNDTYTYNLYIPTDRYRKHVYKSVFDIYCAPADNAVIRKNITNSDGTTTTKYLHCDPAVELMMCTKIDVPDDDSSTSTTSVGTVYDNQILPFCPTELIYDHSNHSTLYSTNYNSFCPILIGYPDTSTSPIQECDIYKDYSTSDGTTTTKHHDFVGLIYFIPNDSIDNTISYSPRTTEDQTNVWNLSGDYTIKSVKEITNLTEFRLSSQDYSQSFSVNPAAVSTTGISKLYVRQSMKPYNPVITVTPDYKGKLYGNINNDEKCLIMTGGGFSMPQVTSAWAQYELSNSNYQSAFNRQISDMEKNKSVEETNSAINATASAISGMVSGATAGAIAGSIVPGLGTVVGAGIGAALGGISSAIAGGVEHTSNMDLAQREIDSAKIQFNYSIQNIQAQPYTLTNTGNNSPLNKYFPRIEYYKASPTDYTNYENTIALNGMTLNRPGKIADSITAKNPFNTNGRVYVSGSLVNLKDDHSLSFEQAQAIAYEISRGQYYE
jgi:outer membrane lipoprotein SlyB